MEAIDCYYAGIQELEKGNYAEAIILFQKSNEMDAHYKTYEKLFVCWNAMTQPDKAFACLEQSYHLNPKCDKIAVEYAKSLTEKGNILLAKHILCTVLKRNASYKPAETLLKHIQ